jgi:hypothetical protein
MFHIPVTDRLNKRRPCVQKTIGRSGTLFCHFLLILVSKLPPASCLLLEYYLLEICLHGCLLPLPLPASSAPSSSLLRMSETGSAWVRCTGTPAASEWGPVPC